MGLQPSKVYLRTVTYRLNVDFHDEDNIYLTTLNGWDIGVRGHQMNTPEEVLVSQLPIKG